MTRLSAFGAAAALATMLASPALTSPAMAQEVISNPGYCAQFSPDANCQNKGANNPYTGDYQRRQAYRQHDAVNDWNGDWTRHGRNDGRQVGWNDDRTFRPDSPTAFDDSRYTRNDYDANARAGGGWYDPNYSTRGWFVCTPGGYFRGEDGHRHLCQ